MCNYIRKIGKNIKQINNIIIFVIFYDIWQKIK